VCLSIALCKRLAAKTGIEKRVHPHGEDRGDERGIRPSPYPPSARRVYQPGAVPERDAREHVVRRAGSDDPDNR
jgi:hypothetical protein